MENFLLKLVDAFKWLYTLAGVDHEQLRAIVAVKLKTDNRRQHVAYRGKDKKESGNAFLLTILFYGILGILVAIILYTIPSFILSMILFFSYVIVMVAMTLITDFSSILLDTSDNTIILPRPVDGRTLFVARLTHIMIYLGQIGVGLTLAPAVAVYFRYGLVLLIAFLFLVILSMLAAVFLTNAVYLLILQFSSEEKLKNIINYFQIGMAVAIMGGYQIIPRIIERLDIQTFVFEVRWWNFLLPPVWMAATLEAIEFGLKDTGHIALAVCAVSVPPLGLYLVNKYLTPVFNNKLGAIAITPTPIEDRKSKGSRFLDTISGWFTDTPTERGAFVLIFKILGRDRKIKLKVYPAFGYVVVFGAIFILRGKEAFSTTWSNLPDSQYHLSLLYLIFMVLQVAFYELPYSDDFKASWIYYSSPIEKPGEILSGMVKALIAKLFVPAYLAVSAFVLVIWGTPAIDDIVFAATNNYLMVMALATINKNYLPLSMAPDLRNQSGNLARSIFTFVILGVLGVGHYVLTFKPIVLISLIPVQLILAYFLHRAYKRVGWSDITL